MDGGGITVLYQPHSLCEEPFQHPAAPAAALPVTRWQEGEQAVVVVVVVVVVGGVSDDGGCFQGWERDTSYPTGSPNNPVVPAARPAVKLSVRMFSVGRGVGSPEGLEMLCAFLMGC